MLKLYFTSFVFICITLDKIHARTIKRNNNEGLDVQHSTLGYCSQPLGITRDSINIQVGFTISSRAVPSRIKRSSVRTPWNRDTNNERSYIQVEFERAMYVSGMVTQGSPNTESRVTHFRVTYSSDCIHFHQVVDKQGTHTKFVGNLYVNTTNTVMFDDVLVAKCVRIIPTNTVGEETAIRFELLGCEITNCQTELTPVHEGLHSDVKTFVFDKEKIISFIKITSLSSSVNVAASPAFILAASRSCHFEYDDRLGRNNRTKIYTMDVNNNEVIIDDNHFPLRAQCFVVFSPDPNMIPMHDVDIDGIEGQLHRLEQSEYHVTFYGCDALEPHDALGTCGQTRMPTHHYSREKRVVGGTPSIPGEWPWLISLHFLGTHTYTNNSGLPHICGASLIDPEWIISAAHCFDELAGEGLSDKNNWIAVAGEHYLGNYDGTEQFITVEKIIKHPRFILAYNHPIIHDIALIKLSRPAQQTDYVNTICLDGNYTVPDYTTCHVSGWGLVDVDGVGVELPNTGRLSIVPRQECNASYDSLPSTDDAKQWISIDDSVLCARANEAGIDSCSGDSGGPLVCYHDNHWVQVGIVSIGYACGDLRYPGIYTNMKYFYNWINDVITAETSFE
ncbi:Ovochymase-1 [Mactra antiquata]